jgi:hypothetical protein
MQRASKSKLGTGCATRADVRWLHRVRSLRLAFSRAQETSITQGSKKVHSAARHGEQEHCNGSKRSKPIVLATAWKQCISIARISVKVHLRRQGGSHLILQRVVE